METFLDSYHKDKLEHLVSMTLTQFPMFSLTQISSGLDEFQIRISMTDPYMGSKARLEKCCRMEEDLLSRLNRFGFGVGPIKHSDNALQFAVGVN